MSTNNSDNNAAFEMRQSSVGSGRHQLYSDVQGDSIARHRPLWSNQLGDLNDAAALPDRQTENNASTGSEADEKTSETPEDKGKQNGPEDEPYPKSLQTFTIHSQLIFFSILGTLARLGTQALSLYPGAPLAVSETWANVGGTFVMGYLIAERTIFSKDWNETLESSRKEAQGLSENVEEFETIIGTRARKAHLKSKKPMPLYVGLTVGFCGCYTSFSSFIRDVFLAMADKLNIGATVSQAVPNADYVRARGDSVMALLAVLFVEIALAFMAFDAGTHLAMALENVALPYPKRKTRLIFDTVLSLLGWGVWIGAIVMSIVPPDRPGGPQGVATANQEHWRSQALFALCFAPIGCWLRLHLSQWFNTKFPNFPLGTFIANVSGTLLLGACLGMQQTPLTYGLAGGGQIGCQLLQGVMDGFCGCLTTVSTWVAEMKTLKRWRAYIYGFASVAASFAGLVAILGPLVWGRVLISPVCVT